LAALTVQTNLLAPNTSYWCPYCGQEFPTTAPLREVNAHVQAGERGCNAKREKKLSPPGFWWECAGCGFYTEELHKAQWHSLPGHS